MIEVQLEGCICELNFGYNAKMEGYTNISSGIPELYSIGGRRRGGLRHIFWKAIPKHLKRLTLYLLCKLQTL